VLRGRRDELYGEVEAGAVRAKSSVLSSVLPLGIEFVSQRPHSDLGADNSARKPFEDCCQNLILITRKPFSRETFAIITAIDELSQEKFNRFHQ
jgi:hypothetical protein